MDSEKIDSILNLSLETEPEVREKSDILSNGYDVETNLWEVIVKYHGNISWMEKEVESLELLLNGYAIMLLSEAQLAKIVQAEQIEYVEKPKGFAFDIYQAKQRSCILPVTIGTLGLSGEGVLTAVLDSGIDYLLDDFQNGSGSRILYLWDQTLQPDESTGLRSPAGFNEGVEFTKADIDRAIAAAGQAGGAGQGSQLTGLQAALQIVPSRDITGHGTAVAGIAAGSAVSPLYQGVAPKSDLLIVKLGGNKRSAGGRQTVDRRITEDAPNAAAIQAGSQNFPLTTDIMRGITYVLRKALELGRPAAINLSIGDTYGAHDGTSLLERFLDAACETGRNVICIGSGNEAVSGGHTSLRLLKEERVELVIADNERSVNVQIWKSYVDDMTLELEAPGGQRYMVYLDRMGKQTWIVENTRVLIYVSPPTPYSVNEEIFFDFIPMERFITGGVWTFVFRPIGENSEDIHLFLPNAVVRNLQTRFLQPTPYLSMTIPAFASRAITVAAYDMVLNAYADFSGRDREIGETERIFFAADIKPDIAAPGVNIAAPAAGGGYASFTGTSFAAPIVTGSAALLMEWGIVRGHDRFLYGQKLKAYLRKGAKPLSGDGQYPNIKTGWGALCLSDSLPENLG